ncbi:integrase domain-containing protein [Paraburkholderia sp. MPAMCS5]|nr:integrase domain-containing protein [Paraburkholderia sp. MPAMCS5]
MKIQLNFSALMENAGLPQRLTNELTELFQRHLSKAHSKTRVTSNAISIKTQKYRVLSLVAGFRELRKGGFAIQSPWNLAEKHIGYLVNLWVNEKEQSPGTVENKLTYWRTLAAWMKKHQLVGTMDDYIKRPEGYRRYYVAQEDKSWEAAKVELDDVISRLCERDRWVAIQVELQAAFGLRAQESMLLRPLQCLRVSGHLQVIDGTKGGRPRIVPIDAEWQYEVLIRAARLSNPRTGSMIPEPWPLKKWYRHFYHVLQKEGITRGAKGVTVHGLRHAYLQKMYEQITGVPAPIKRPDHRPDPALHQAAMQRLVEAAGHSLAAKATAYISTFATVERLARPVVSPEQAIAAVVAASGNKSVAAKSLNISRQALYRLIAKCADLSRTPHVREGEPVQPVTMSDPANSLHELSP